ncbi:GNAT family N-acetyltransferase [Streptacidiphilus monticola]
MRTVVTPFLPAEASESELSDCYEAWVSAYADFPDRPAPSYRAFVDLLRSPTNLLGPEQFWVARALGRTVGIASLTLPQHENTRLTVTSVRVLPKMRRHGVGTALLRATLPTAKAAGRTTVTGQGLKSGGEGEKWATALGFAKVQEFVLQRLVVADVSPDLWAVPMPPGFEVLRWTGAAPEALLASYAQARTAISDAPTGASSLEFASWTPDRVRRHEAELRARGDEQRVVVAVHEDSGRVAGLTEMITTPSRPELGIQQETAVLAEFRGAGLGRVIKAAMMRWLIAERPETELVITNTDAGNAHMIRVNLQIGYVTDYIVSDVEADLGRLL